MHANITILGKTEPHLYPVEKNFKVIKPHIILKCITKLYNFDQFNLLPS